MTLQQKGPASSPWLTRLTVRRQGKTPGKDTSRRCGLKAETYAAVKRSLRAHQVEVPADAIERLRDFAWRLAAAERTDEDPATA